MNNSPFPTGSDEEALFHQETWGLTRGPAAKLRNSSTIKISRTPQGIYLRSISKGGGAAAPFVCRQFTYASCTANCLVMSDGTYVAKPPLLRNSIASRTRDGVTWNYTYYTGAGPIPPTYLARTANNGAGYVPYQRVMPDYQAGDLIYALPITPSTLDGHPVAFVDANVDGRAWAVKADQTTP